MSSKAGLICVARFDIMCVSGGHRRLARGLDSTAGTHPSGATSMSPNDQDKEIVERLIADTNLSARMDALIGEICDKLREYGVASPHKAFNDLVDPFREYFMLEYEEERGLEDAGEEVEDDEEEDERSY